MNWILEHLQVVFYIVFAAIAYFVNATRKKAAEQKPKSRVEQARDPEEAARTRRIQEEIQRKIIERRMGTARAEPARSAPSAQTLPPPLVAPRPVSSSMGGLREKLDARLAQARAREAAQRAAEENEQRINLQEQQQEQERRDARKRAEMTAALKENARVKAARASSGSPVSQTWLTELRNPVSARRAIVMREVLGTPVGLR